MRLFLPAQEKEMMSMEARFIRGAVLSAALVSLGASYRTPNFVVTAPTDEIARQVATQAETFRRDLAVEWIGQPMPTWSQPCPIVVQVGNHLGAGGATSFVFNHGEVFGWQMSIQGPLDRVLDSVLPHEVTHTIFASHFRRPVPRWADEGGCTTVEHDSERIKQQKMLIAFLRTGRGIPFSQMFAMKEYPRDILPLYAQGHSLASYLVAQGGRQKFLTYLAEGMENEDWVAATERHYGYEDLAGLQNSWLSWVRQGSPLRPAASSGEAIAQVGRRPRPASNLIIRGQSEDPRPAPAQLASLPRAGQHDPQGSAGDGWYAAGNRTAAIDAGPVLNQVTRPQPVERSRQVILEWNRLSAPNAAGTSGPQPVAQLPEAKGSIYEARGRQALLR
jgi:hypothetical protein